MPEPAIDQQRFQVVHSEIETRHKIIAALKVQRWEVLKWAVALNVGLVTAWVAIGKPPTLIFTILATGVAVGAIILIWHYNERARGARGDLLGMFKLLDPVIRYDELRAPRTAERIKKKSYFHDGWELFLFTAILLTTVVLTYLVTGLSR
jgi:hypothetical protein